MPPDPIPAAQDPPPPAMPRRRRSRMPWLIAAIGFAIGGLAMVYILPLVERWRAPVAVEPQPAVQAVAAPPATVPAPLTADALTGRALLLDSQLRAIEARMAAADAASRAAAANATRAEALMIALAARRELNRGLPLGYLEGELRNRFGARQPRAVAIVIAASHAPVTLEDLRFALDTIAPTLTTGAMHEGVWNAATRELRNLIILRRESTPSPQPADRLTRARRLIDSGQVEAALAEVSRLPGAANATSWTDAARRYIESRRALGALERAAIVAIAPTPPPATDPAGALP